MTASPLSSPPRRRERTSLLLGAAIALYLIALVLPGAAAPHTSLSSAWLLVLGWSTLSDVLSDRGSLLAVGIGLSHLAAIMALWASSARSSAAALLAGLGGGAGRAGVDSFCGQAAGG